VNENTADPDGDGELTVGGNRLWKVLEDADGNPGHTWQSLRTRYNKNLQHRKNQRQNRIITGAWNARPLVTIPSNAAKVTVQDKEATRPKSTDDEIVEIDSTHPPSTKKKTQGEPSVHPKLDESRLSETELEPSRRTLEEEEALEIDAVGGSSTKLETHSTRQPSAPVTATAVLPSPQGGEKMRIYRIYEAKDDETIRMIATHLGLDGEGILRLNLEEYENLTLDAPFYEGTRIRLPDNAPVVASPANDSTTKTVRASARKRGADGPPADGQGSAPKRLVTNTRNALEEHAHTFGQSCKKLDVQESEDDIESARGGKQANTHVLPGVPTIPESPAEDIEMSQVDKAERDTFAKDKFKHICWDTGEPPHVVLFAVHACSGDMQMAYEYLRSRTLCDEKKDTTLAWKASDDVRLERQEELREVFNKEDGLMRGKYLAHLARTCRK